MSAKNANLVMVERTNSGDAGTVGNGTITVGVSDGLGSLISTGQDDGNSAGTMALGKVDSAGTIQAQAYGTKAHGYASNNAIITTEKSGSQAFGRADGKNGDIPSQISANGEGSLAFGKVSSGAVIGTTYEGSQAFGESSNGGSVETLGPASLAFGKTISGSITTSGEGSQAMGSVGTAGSNIGATGNGSKAFGTAFNGHNVQATNNGAMAFGVAENESITASGQGSLAMGFPLAGPVVAAGVGSQAFGDANTSNGRLSTTLGSMNTNDSYHCLMIGRNGSTAGNDSTTWVETDALFVAGNGSAENGPSNAYHLAKDGRVTTTASQSHKAIKMVSGTYGVNPRLDRTVIFNTSSVVGVANLPVGEDGLEVFIVDGSNHANTKNITINVSGSDLFQNGNSSDTINTDSGLRHYQFLTGVWYILSKN